MLFNSYQFVIFFGLVFVLNFLLPHKFRWVILLASSYYFYMSWDPKMIVLIIFTTLLHYFAGMYIHKNKDKPKIRKFILVTAILASLAILLFFKYFNFFTTSVSEAFALFSIKFDPVILKLALPMGISFYTFQTLSYTIDVYREKIQPESHPGYMALYVSYFPQLIAGPIGRAGNLLPQFKAEKKMTVKDFDVGIKRVAIGLFKKIVVADTFAKAVNVVYNDVHQFNGFILLVATLMFAVQIYCDFSGYSDMALGVAKMMGIDLMENFRSPYLSKSIKEFWGRWHISLSTWFKDYVYIPLGGNRKGKIRTNFNLFATFLLSGLWHGANLTFIIWGALHGFYQVIERALKIGAKIDKSKAKIALLGIVPTFALVCFAWIFFRANTLDDAFYVIKNMFDGIKQPRTYLAAIKPYLNITSTGIKILFGELLMLLVIDIGNRNGRLIEHLNQRKAWLRWGICVLFVFVVFYLSTKSGNAEFIYAQF